MPLAPLRVVLKFYIIQPAGIQKFAGSSAFANMYYGKIDFATTVAQRVNKNLTIICLECGANIPPDLRQDIKSPVR
jgi:hypothetical protein